MTARTVGLETYVWRITKYVQQRLPSDLQPEEGRKRGWLRRLHLPIASAFQHLRDARTTVRTKLLLYEQERKRAVH